MKLLSFALVLALALAACTGNGEPDASPTSPAGSPPSATLLGQNLDVFPGPDQAVKVGFTPFGSSARVIVRFEPARAVVDVCPIASIGEPPPDREGCKRDVRTGVRETITAARLGGIAIVVRSDESVSFDLVVEYEEGERAIEIALPVLPAPAGGADCSDNACNPFFELQPTNAGAFEASATWDGPEGGLVLLQGSVLGRAHTATGIPYGEPTRDEGSPPLEVSTRLTAPAEYALALRHARQGSAVPPMRDIVLSVSWP